MSTENLRMIYFYAHSLMSYGIIFWDNSRLSNFIFKLQKKKWIEYEGAIRDPCCKIFNVLKILTRLLAIFRNHFLR
jgi:hypothetical protein